MKKFWNWIHDDSGGRVLRLEGPIDEDDFWGDSVTPKMFRDELYTDEGDITLWINSPGGNVFCAAEIYTMLRDYPGSVTVRIASIAASAASVVAMAGNLVQMSPTALMMLHDPSTIAMGNARDMEKAITTLNEVKESIINAYAFKTGLSRNRISKLMSDETWLNAKKAVELGFADEILFENKPKPDTEEDPDDPGEDNDPDTEEDGDEGEEGGEKKKPFKLAEAMWQYSSRLMGETILNRLSADDVAECDQPTQEASPETQEPDRETVTADTDADLTEEGTQPEPSETGTEPPAGDNDPAGTEPQVPVIGLDGKTKDGAMPYEILKDKLEWLK